MNRRDALKSFAAVAVLPLASRLPSVPEEPGLWHNGTDYAVARNRDEAAAIVAKTWDCKPSDCEGEGWYEIDPDYAFTWSEDCDDKIREVTARQLVAEYGIGYAGSSDY